MQYIQNLYSFRETQKKINERKDILLHLCRQEWKRKYGVGYMPDFNHEIANDHELNLLYSKLGALICSTHPYIELSKNTRTEVWITNNG